MRTLATVELPLIVPSLISGGTVVFLVAFSEYFLVSLIGGGAVNSIASSLFAFLNSADRPIASAYTLLFIAIPILLMFVIDLTVRRSYRRMGLLGLDAA